MLLPGDDLLDGAPRPPLGALDREARRAEVIERIAEQVDVREPRHERIEQLFRPAHDRDRTSHVVQDQEAAIGLQDVVIAHTPDATLICHVSQTEQIKTLLERIEQHGRTKFL